MKTLLLSTLLIFFCTILYGQADFKPGYVITLTGDTLRGEIDYRGDILMSRECRFRPEENAQVITFYPGDIQSYRFPKQKYYVSETVDSTLKFVEFLVDGIIDIYYYRVSNTENQYLLRKDDGKLIKIPFVRETRYYGGKAYVYESSLHKGILWYHMQEAPRLQGRINAMKQPRHKTLVDLAEDYHKQVCEDDQQCIVYRKAPPLLKPGLELSAGIIRFPDDNFITDGYLRSLSGYIWLPRINERWYLKLGVQNYSTIQNNQSFQQYRILVQFAYIYPGKILSPKAGLGRYIYGTKTGRADASRIWAGQSNALMAGMNIKLIGPLKLSLTYDLDLGSNPILIIIPTKIFSHSLSAGLFMEF